MSYVASGLWWMVGFFVFVLFFLCVLGGGGWRWLVVGVIVGLLG